MLQQSRHSCFKCALIVPVLALSISAQRCCSTENMGSTKALNYNPNVNPGDEKWHERQSLPGSSYFKFRWPTYNDRIYKPGLFCLKAILYFLHVTRLSLDGTYRPAFVCHMRPLVKYSPDKMFYVAGFVRGLTVDEAIKQLSFVQVKILNSNLRWLKFFSLSNEIKS